MKPRLVEISLFQEIVRASAEKNVAVFFYGSENVLLFGNENVLDQVVDEMIYALGYVPRYIRKESLLDQDKLARKLDIAMKSSIVNV
jgi:hypothetical protein